MALEKNTDVTYDNKYRKKLGQYIENRVTKEYEMKAPGVILAEDEEVKDDMCRGKQCADNN